MLEEEGTEGNIIYFFVLALFSVSTPLDETRKQVEYGDIGMLHSCSMS